MPTHGIALGPTRFPACLLVLTLPTSSLSYKALSPLLFSPGPSVRSTHRLTAATELGLSGPYVSRKLTLALPFSLDFLFLFTFLVFPQGYVY